MMFLFRMLLLLSTAPWLLADSNSNAVNERIPVRKAEIEAHWNVNCKHNWARMEKLRSRSGGEKCVLPPDLQRQLQLCAFIYQPPGEESTHSGPDFQAAINKECPP
jgi:hypothetical protein